jgi:hypothetical protein
VYLSHVSPRYIAGFSHGPACIFPPPPAAVPCCPARLVNARAASRASFPRASAVLRFSATLEISRAGCMGHCSIHQPRSSRLHRIIVLVIRSRSIPRNGRLCEHLRVTRAAFTQSNRYLKFDPLRIPGRIQSLYPALSSKFRHTFRTN